MVIYLFSIKFNENSNNIIYKIAKIAKNGMNHKLKEVPVSYGLNNDIYFPTLVSITSILLNANNNTYYKIYILVSSNRTQFSNENKRKFKHLERKYKMCKIFIIEINDKIFSFAKLGKYPTPTYYRIIIARLLPNEKRIIYIDGDTLILRDLTEMIYLKMNNKIIMGFIDHGDSLSKKYNLKSHIYITAGVLLINLEVIRKENITEKFFDSMKKNKFMNQQDQSLINLVLNEKIGLLPPKYGIWAFWNIKDLLTHNKYYKNNRLFTYYKNSELIKAYKNPGILHFVRQKPYTTKYYRFKTKFINLWFHYAKKTGQLQNIIKYYNLTNFSLII